MSKKLAFLSGLCIALSNVFAETIEVTISSNRETKYKPFIEKNPNACIVIARPDSGCKFVNPMVGNGWQVITLSEVAEFNDSAFFEHPSCVDWEKFYCGFAAYFCVKTALTTVVD